MEQFAAKLDRFGQERRILAKAVAPLSVAIDEIEAGIDGLAAGGDADKEDYLELLRRRALVIQNGRARVESASLAAISRASSSVRHHASDLTSLLTPKDLTDPPSQSELDTALGKAEAAVRGEGEKLEKDLQANIAKEVLRTNDELQALASGELARSLEERVFRTSGPELGGNHEAPKGTAKPDSVFRKQMKAGMSKLGKAMADMEKADVKGLAKLFNVKFKPWGAGKALGRLQGLGKAMGAAAGALELVFHIIDEMKRHEAEKSLEAARRDVLADFSKTADEFYENAKTDMQGVLDEVFGPAAAEVNEERNRIRAQQEGQASKLKDLELVLASAKAVWQSAVRYGGASG